jgi:hypothetical protein
MSNDFWQQASWMSLFSTIILIVWGWVRWLRLPRQKSITAVLSLVGFILATAAALTGVSAAVYSSFPDGPIILVGFLLSLGSLILGLGGIWKANSLRWHAPVSSLATFAFWYATLAGAMASG